MSFDCTKNNAKRIILEANDHSSSNAARVWLLDSGASFHSVSSKSLTQSEKRTVRERPPLKLRTANGIVTCTKMVTVWVHALQIKLDANLMDSSPELISMGLLVKEVMEETEHMLQKYYIKYY